MARTVNKAARRAARSLVLQILYEIDLARHDPTMVLADHLLEANFDEEGERFAREVVPGVVQHRAALDGYIQEVAPEWPVEQMAPVDRNILRMAIYELLHRRGTPVKVAINEAVELARLYGSDNSRRFVNGALGTFAARHLDTP
ncbi:MAG: transcription antitermination factor NusB [Ardenticatenales bacterium]|nr:transcription antitermination factor NusB [Ardenticatenales bacterium]